MNISSASTYSGDADSGNADSGNADSGDAGCSDAELFTRIADRDSSALRILHDRYRELVYTVALGVCGQPQDAESILVTVFWEVWRKPERWNPDRGSARMYLYVLSRSRARDLIRTQTARRGRLRLHRENLALHHAARVPHDPPERGLDVSMLVKSMHVAIETLPVELRSVIEMAFLQGMTHSEIAESLAMPLGSVKSRIRRGLRVLRGELDEPEHGDVLP